MAKNGDFSKNTLLTRHFYLYLYSSEAGFECFGSLLSKAGSGNFGGFLLINLRSKGKLLDTKYIIL